MQALLDVILPVFLVIGFGYAAARARLFEDSAVDGLMRYAQNFAAPTLLFASIARLDLAALGQLTFQSPDETRFPALRLARDVMRNRGLTGAAFNAAKEIALDHFIAGGLGFLQMANVVEETLNRLSAESRLGNAAGSLEDVLAMDHLARVRATEVAGQMRAA